MLNKQWASLAVTPPHRLLILTWLALIKILQLVLNIFDSCEYTGSLTFGSHTLFLFLSRLSVSLWPISCVVLCSVVLRLIVHTSYNEQQKWVTGAHAVCHYALNRLRGCFVNLLSMYFSGLPPFEKLREHCSVPERKRKRSLTIRRTFYTNWFVIASYSCGSKRKRLTMLQSVKKPVGLFFLLELSFTAKCWNKLKNKPHNLYRNYTFVPEYLMLLLLVCLLIIFSVMSN